MNEGALVFDARRLVRRVAEPVVVAVVATFRRLVVCIVVIATRCDRVVIVGRRSVADYRDRVLRRVVVEENAVAGRTMQIQGLDAVVGEAVLGDDIAVTVLHSHGVPSREHVVVE